MAHWLKGFVTNPGTHLVERTNRLLKIVLWLPNDCYACIHTYTHD